MEENLAHINPSFLKYVHSEIWTCKPMPLSNLMEHVTADDMVSNEAKWNWSCYNKVGTDGLDGAKRKREEDGINLSVVMRAVPNVFAHSVNLWIKVCAYFVQMLVVARLH